MTNACVIVQIPGRRRRSFVVVAAACGFFCKRKHCAATLFKKMIIEQFSAFVVSVHIKCCVNISMIYCQQRQTTSAAGLLAAMGEHV